MPNEMLDQIETTWKLFQPPPETKLAWMSRRPEIVGGGLDSLAQMRALANRYRTDCYFTPNPVVPGFSRRPSTVHVAYVSFVVLDLDPASPEVLSIQNGRGAMGPDEFRNLRDVFEREVTDRAQDLLGFELHPDRIDSGRGRQLWLRFEPRAVPTQEEKSQWRNAVGAFLHRLDQAVGVVGNMRLDTSCCDLPRLVRLPGTINTKTGRLAQFLGVGEPDDRIYSTILGRFGVSSPQVSVPRPTPGDNWRTNAHWLSGKAKRFLFEGVGEPGRHSAAFAAASSLREIGVGREEIEMLVVRGAGRCWPPLDEWEARRAVRNAFEKGEMNGA